MSRAVCSACLRPTVTCLCGWVRPTDNPLPVLVLQHPLEERHAKGSARLLALSLSRCRLAVGEVFAPADLETGLAELGARPLLLYPSTPALPAPPEAQGPPTGLVVIDATWRKSLRMLHLHPRLLTLPRLALQAPPPSRYLVRSAPREGHRSTLEATCLALSQLERGDGLIPSASRYTPLLAAFDGFVDGLSQWPQRRHPKP